MVGGVGGDLDPGMVIARASFTFQEVPDLYSED